MLALTVVVLLGMLAALTRYERTGEEARVGSGRAPQWFDLNGLFDPAVRELDLINLTLLVFLPAIFAAGLLVVPARFKEFMRWWRCSAPPRR